MTLIHTDIWHAGSSSYCQRFFQFMILIFKCLLVYILLYVTSCGLLTSFKRQVRSSSSRSEEGSAGMANVAVKQTRAENCN